MDIEWKNQLQHAVITFLLSEDGRPKRWSEIYEKIRKAGKGVGGKTTISCSKTTLSNELKKLEEKGWLERLEENKRRVKYRLVAVSETRFYLKRIEEYRERMNASYEKKKRTVSRFITNVCMHVLDENEAIAFLKGIIHDFECDLILGLETFLLVKPIWFMIAPEFIENWYIRTYNLRIKLFDAFFKVYPEATSEAVKQLLAQKMGVIHNPEYQEILSKMRA